MADYTAEEYTDMLIVYGAAGENARAAARLYAERFPGRERQPYYQTILRCVQRARETGMLMLNWRNAGAPVRYNVQDEERILRVFEENPRNSVRRASRMLGLSRYVVHRVLRQNGLHPYHHRRVQQLLPRDHEQRVYFCQGIFIISSFHILYLININSRRNTHRVPCAVSAE